VRVTLGPHLPEQRVATDWGAVRHEYRKIGLVNSYFSWIPETDSYSNLQDLFPSFRGYVTLSISPRDLPIFKSTSKGMLKAAAEDMVRLIILLNLATLFSGISKISSS